MNVFDVFGQSVWRPLVFALIHTLWQGGLIALATAVALRCLPARRQSARYLVSLTAQFGVLVAGLLTWAALGYEPPRAVETRPVRIESVGAVAFVGAVESVRVDTHGSASEPSGAVPWVPIVAVGWLSGVALMIVRAAASALAAVGLTRGSEALDGAIRDAVEGLRTAMGITRPIRVVACERCPGPAVLGLVWPTVVLPVSMMSGLTPEAIRAILAHELAHIQRFDYVFNLAQMLVESLLFFNPAVWWLGRQARIEREACCDAIAVRLTGRPLEYSRVLADWAERVCEAAPMPGLAIAWSGEGRPSTLRERVMRVLRPGETPRSRLSWTGLVVMLVVGPLVVFALKWGADNAVTMAAQALSTAERVEKLKEAKAEYAPPEIVGDVKATLKGRLHAPGGKPLAKPVPAAAMSHSRNGSYTQALDLLGDTFSVEVHPGVVWLSLTPKEFAPVVAGPFEAKPGATVEGIDIVFEPGFPARVRVVDENGKPVVGASVVGGLVIAGGSWYSVADLITDGDGLVTVPHAARGLYSMSAQAKGFQTPQSREMTLRQGETTSLTLVHARPTSGVVVGPDGALVEGAKIRPYLKYRPQNSQGYSSNTPVFATTDADGRFRIDALDDDWSYALIVESDRLGRRLVTGVRAGQEGLKWTVGPNLTISGTVKGDITALEKNQGKPFVAVTQGGREFSEGLRIPTVSTTVPIEPADGGGRFTVSGVLPGAVVLAAGRHVVKLDVEKPDNQVTIDLTKAEVPTAKRRVVIRVVTPGGADQATGSIAGFASDTATEPSYRPYDLPLKEGKVSLDVPTPGQVSYLSQSVIGYWFKDGNVEVPPGDQPLVVDLKAVPAAAIVGRVLDADGKPAVDGVSLGASVVEKSPAMKWDEFIQLNNVHVDSGGRFFLGPLPIGGTYAAVAARGHNKQASTPVRLDGSKATVSVEVRLARPVPGGGRVVDPDGRPVAGVPVTLQLKHAQAGTSWGPPTPTDRDGRFQFDDLSSEIGPYTVTIDARKDYVPVEANLKPGGPPVEIRLERGRVVTGRVVDAKTGWPIPGVDMYAARKQFKAGDRYGYESEGLTDEQGRFRFSNLPEVPLEFNDRAGLRWEESKGSRDIPIGRAEPVEIRGTLPSWSKLKPVAH